MPARDAERGSRFDLAIVGSSPPARDLREALLERRFPFREVRLLGTPGAEMQITEFAGEPRLVSPAEPEALKGVHLAFFCEDPATGGAYRDWPERDGYLAIDLTGGSGPAGPPPMASLRDPDALPAPRHGWLAAAHPLSHLLATLVTPLEIRTRLLAVRGVVLRPASDFGQAGLDELYGQSVNLLNFTELPREVFARQLAFNIIPGEILDRGRRLEAMIASQVCALLGRPDMPVSVFLAVAPVFHAHTAVLHLEFESRPAEDDLRDLLRGTADLRVDAEPLTPVETGEERRPHVGLVRRDAEGRGAWLWAVADGVAAAAAGNAVSLAERMLGVESRPRPRVSGRAEEEGD